MTPISVHRYSWLQQEAIELLLGDVLSDCQQWQIRIDGDQVVVDIVPIEQEFPGRAADTARKPVQDAAPERKGGPLARRAAMMCGYGAFHKYLAEKRGVVVSDANGAKAWMLEQFGISSRADLDHEPAPAASFQEVEKAYKLWMEGYD